MKVCKILPSQPFLLVPESLKSIPFSFWFAIFFCKKIGDIFLTKSKGLYAADAILLQNKTI